MDCRGLVVLSAVLVAGSIPLLPACKGPDPGAITFQERPGGQVTDPTETSTSSSGTTPAPTDGGATGEGGASDDPFFKTAFALHPTDPPDQVANAKADGTHTGQIPLQGDGTAAAAPKTCVVGGCHEGGATPWIAGGSVFAAATGGLVPAGVKYEIGINKPDGTLLAAVTPDKDGNFWFDTAGPIPDGSTVAIRKEGGKSVPMVTKLTAANKGGNCNNATGCHGGAALRIYAP